MQEQIVKVELVLENCEVITIEGKYIGEFRLENITYSIRRKACNYIGESEVAKHFSMSINRDCNKEEATETSFGTATDWKRNKFERIRQYDDITSIYVYFKGKKKPKVFYTNWGGESEYENDYQKSYINEFGDLFIVIDEKLNIEETFGTDEINDKEIIDFTWSMYS